MSEQPSERALEELISRAIKDDDTALEILLRHFQPVIRRAADARLSAQARSLADPDDIVQEALVAAFRRLSMFEIREHTVAQFTSWLSQIAERAVANTERRVRRGVNRLGEELHDELSAKGSSKDPGYQVTRLEQAALLAEHIAKLPELERKLIYLSYFEGKTHAEAGAAVGLNSGTVNMRLARARHTLREALGTSSLYQLPPKKRRPPSDEPA